MKNVLVIDLLNSMFTLKHFKERDPLWRFIGDVRNVVSALKIDKVILACDTGQSQYRLSKYPQYKETRRARREAATEAEKAELEEFFKVVDRFKVMAPIFGFEVAAIPGVEADDIVAYFSIMANPEKVRIANMSSDTDLFQLLRPNVVQRSYGEKMKLLDIDIPQQVWVTEARFIEAYEMTPYQYMEAKSIAGDKGDSIYSPESVGETTGLKLIRRYGSIDEVEKNLDNLDIPRFSAKGREALKRDFWMVRRNVELVSLLHSEEKFNEIFGDRITDLEDILERVDHEPPQVDESAIKEYLFSTGRVNIYDNFDVWVQPFKGGN